MLNDAICRYAGKLAFALCPTPLNTECNLTSPRMWMLSKTHVNWPGLAWRYGFARREVFPVFEDWMFTFDSGNSWSPRSLETTRAKAVELVGQEKFDTAWSDPWIGQYIQTCIRIYSQTIQSGKVAYPNLFSVHIGSSPNCIMQMTLL